MKKQYTIFFDDNFSYKCRVTMRRDGFNHVCRVYNVNGVFLRAFVSKYYNRTWESFQFQSVIEKARAAFGEKSPLRA